MIRSAILLTAVLLVSCSNQTVQTVDTKSATQATEPTVSTSVGPPDNPVGYWKYKWPRLADYNFSGVTLLIDPALVVTDKLTTDEGGTNSFAKIRISNDSSTFSVTWFKESKHDSLSFDIENKSRFWANDSICIPNDGHVYTSEFYGHDESLRIVRVFSIVGDELKETKQPYYSTSLEASGNSEIELHRGEDDDSDIVDVIPEGQTISIVGISATDRDRFLIKTPSGLLGWHKVHLLGQVEGEGPLPRSKYSLSFYDGVYP